MNMKFLLGMVLALVIFANPASATNFGVDVRSILVTPTEPNVGDTISINVRFYLTGPTDPKVKLFLYVDGDLKDTFTDFFDLGTQFHTFTLDTRDMSAGTKSIVVEAEVYDNGILHDASSNTINIFLTDAMRVSRVHDITITQLSYKNPALAGERIPVTVFVKNTGLIEERNIRIVVRLGDEIGRSESFNVKRGEITARTVYIKAPRGSGTYDIIIEAENWGSSWVVNRAFYRVENKIDVVSASLTMNPLPSSASPEEWVSISGYAFTSASVPAQSVSIYKDGQYVSSASTDRSGYYSTSVRFFSTGPHTAGVRLGDIEQYSIINIAAPAPAAPAYTPAVAQPGETVIIVRDGRVQAYYGGRAVPTDGAAAAAAPTPIAVPAAPQNITPSSPYVSVTPSAKEVYVEQYRANVLYVDITNRLGRAAVFGIKTDFSPKVVFSPKVETIRDGETKTLAVVFNPGEGAAGMISGNVIVYEGDNIVNSFPVNLFVIQKKGGALVSSGFEMPSFAKDLALLGIIAALLMGYAAIRLRKPKPLEPKIMPFAGGAAGKAQAVAPMQRKINSSGIFRVPWGNIIS